MRIQQESMSEFDAIFSDIIDFLSLADPGSDQGSRGRKGRLGLAPPPIRSPESVPGYCLILLSGSAVELTNVNRGFRLKHNNHWWIYEVQGTIPLPSRTQFSLISCSFPKKIFK